MLVVPMPAGPSAATRDLPLAAARPVRVPCFCTTMKPAMTHISMTPGACRETYIKTEPGESPNDRNDRAIRHAAAW